MTPPDAKEIRSDSLIDSLEKARQVVVELSWGTRQWVMSIPAEPSRDPDLIISKALRDAMEYIRAISTLHQQHEKELREAFEAGHSSGYDEGVNGYGHTTEQDYAAFLRDRERKGNDKD